MRLVFLLLLVSLGLLAQETKLLAELGEQLSYENDTTRANAYVKSKGQFYDFSLHGDTLRIEYELQAEMINQSTGEIYSSSTKATYIMPILNIGKIKVKKDFLRDFDNCLTCFIETGASLIFTGTDCEKPFASRTFSPEFRPTGYISVSTERAKDVVHLLQLAQHLHSLAPTIELKDLSKESPGTKF